MLSDYLGFPEWSTICWLSDYCRECGQRIWLDTIYRQLAGLTRRLTPWCPSTIVDSRITLLHSRWFFEAIKCRPSSISRRRPSHFSSLTWHVSGIGDSFVSTQLCPSSTRSQVPISVCLLWSFNILRDWKLVVFCFHRYSDAGPTYSITYESVRWTNSTI